MTATIGLSHDVDIPIKHILNTIKSYKNYMLDPTRNDYWRFDDIIELEQEMGTRSTFYFCTHNRYGKIGHENDVAYNLQTRRFKEVMKKLENNGFSIGLHAGINQYTHPDSFVESQKIFKSILGHKVLGVRHHWWHVGPNPYTTFRHHYNAGFRYDTSLCKEEITGFYDGIFHPHYIGRTMEIPTFLEDAHMVYYKNTTFKDFTNWIGRLIECNGTGCIDWHVRTSSPHSNEYKDWGMMYQRILRYLANKDEVNMTDIDSIYKNKGVHDR